MCIECVVLPELAHLIEPSHSVPFKAILDQHQPQWQIYRHMLNDLSLEQWSFNSDAKLIYLC
jgi:predicted metal-dependent hydrolase